MTQDDTKMNKHKSNQNIPKFVYFNWNIVLLFCFNRW